MILNGGISTFEDVQTALAFSGCDGVMSSESILEYPALFDNSRIYDLDDLCLEYLDMYEKYPGEADIKIAKAHMHKFLYSGFTLMKLHDLRQKMVDASTVE